MPGYKKRNRLRKSTILHPTDFGQISLLQRIVSCLATARQQLGFPWLGHCRLGFLPMTYESVITIGDHPITFKAVS